MLKAVKTLIKKYLYAALNVPYNTFGVPTAITKHFKKHQSIVLIDIGAHDGDFTKAIEKYCGVSLGLLVEPIPCKANLLRQNFNSQKYQIFDCVLSSSAGTSDFRVNALEMTSSILDIQRNMPELSGLELGDLEVIQCFTRTLDSIVAKTDIYKIDLLKIDVQGAEHLVLAGAKETLLKVAMVWTEVSFKALYDGSSTFTDIYNLLTQAGFQLLEIEPGFRSFDGELLQADALFINSKWK
jgi:FkbM family methyltransferase